MKIICPKCGSDKVEFHIGYDSNVGHYNTLLCEDCKLEFDKSEAELDSIYE